MKKLTMLLAALCLSLVLTACGGGTTKTPTVTPTPVPTLACGGTDSHILKHTDDIPASCIRDGYSVFACECGIVVYETIPADESLHVWENFGGYAGSMLSDGVRDEYCTVCGQLRITGQSKSYHDHAEGGLECVDWKPATCTEAGYYDNRCAECDEQLVMILPAEGHEYTVTANADTPCEAAVVTYTCEKCGDTYTKEYSAAHQFYLMDNKIVEATCTEAGSFTSVCELCGKEITWEIPARGHDYATKEYTPEGCMGDGLVRYECSRCGDIIEKCVPGHRDHVLEEKTITEPTCVKDGKITSTCYFCGETVEEVIPATGEHEWDIEAIGGCNDYVVWKMTCSLCGATKTEKKDFKGHSYGMGEINVVEPTCTEPGTEKGKCAVCGEPYEISVDPYGHDFVVCAEPGTFAELATCTEPQYYTLECTRCGLREQVIQAAPLGHFIDQSQEVNYTLICGEPIVEKGTCYYCGQYVECVGSDPLQHEFIATGKGQPVTTTTQIPFYDEWDEYDEKGNFIEHHNDLIGYDEQTVTNYILEYECMYCHITKWE